MRMPVQYLANLLTAGKEAPIRCALNRLIAMRSYQRSVHVEGKADTRALEAAGITEDQAKEMYRYLAIANYEDRFVIPTGHAEDRLEDVLQLPGTERLHLRQRQFGRYQRQLAVPRRRKETVEPAELAPSADER